MTAHTTKTALLRHDLPGGDWHFDWLIERAGGQALLSFRTTDRVDDAATTGFRAERIGDHRPAYLEYEGEISGGRGRVRRVASGVCRLIREGPDAVAIEVEFGGVRRLLVGRPGENGWHFHAAEGVAPDLF